ncbi:MAG: DUF3826 domain-containing protein [Prevotellaceae bacterium]|nr:DUF3826 domain-containing protein [Prevotellaceae bacterium]
MKNLLTSALACALCVSPAPAQDTSADAAYMKVVTERAAKIMVALNLDDSLKFVRVRDIIAVQYRDLNAIHNGRNAVVAQLREQCSDNRDCKIEAAENEANASLYSLHCAYLAKLQSELSIEQVDKVKDGMTYGVAPLTYRAQCDMIPSLSDEQKRYIMAALLEAREHAMDAESSEKKHAWFGKYKGRINNYLSAQGYDLKKERETWNKKNEK